MSAHFVSFYFVCAFILTASSEVRIREISFAHCFILTLFLLAWICQIFCPCYCWSGREKDECGMMNLSSCQHRLKPGIYYQSIYYFFFFWSYWIENKTVPRIICLDLGSPRPSAKLLYPHNFMYLPFSWSPASGIWWEAYIIRLCGLTHASVYPFMTLSFLAGFIRYFACIFLPTNWEPILH